SVLGIGVYGALYGIGGPDGNGADRACTTGVETAKEIRSLANGEIAAIQMARKPTDLSQIGYIDADGAATTIGENSGRVTLVNLWATWCAPCRKEMPALDRLQGELGGETFAVLPINIDTAEAAKPRAFLESIETQNLALNTDPEMETFEAMKKRGLALGLPVTVLIDRQGCLIGHMNGPAEWDSDDAKALIKAAIAAAGV
ncbi:MAG TPA: TlpA disulfide reductase family protein, partial [Afifellaceae bacterium]|nr:TlpA disulfide reductase family protein [Afifellaceae bacterium]